MRHTKGHTANRRSHHALKTARFMTCPKCSAKHLAHRMCEKCGTYRGRLVVDTMKKALKKAKKAEGAKSSNKPEGEKKVESTEKETKKPTAKSKTKKEEVKQ